MRWFWKETIIEHRSVPGFRIRIDSMRIRIRIRIQHFFKLRIRIPDPDPGFDGRKLKKLQLKKKKILF
jgi:hypothetical protein